MARTSKLPKRLQPMLATLTDGPFDDNDWIFEDKYDGFRMVARPPQCLALFSLKVKYRYPDRERHVCLLDEAPDQPWTSDAIDLSMLDQL